MEKKYSFEEFAPDLLSVIKSCNSYFDESQIDKLRNYAVNFAEEIESEDLSCEDVLSDTDYFYGSLGAEKEELTAYIEQYFEMAESVYNHCNGYNGFSGIKIYLWSFNTVALYLCVKYYENIKDTEKADRACLYLLSSISSGENEDDKKLLPYVEYKLEDVKRMIYPDWIAVNPLITWAVGSYFKEKGEYEKAFEWFKLGSELDYEDRQSYEPCKRVGLNKYELGQCYYKGCGTEKDFTEAIHCFEAAAEFIGEPSLPVLGDMYYEGIYFDEDGELSDEGPDYDEAFRCYTSFNRYNLNKNIYFKNISDQQKERLTLLLDKRINKPDLTLDELILYSEIYRYRLSDSEKAEEFDRKKLEKVLDTPVEDRTDEMDMIYVDYILPQLSKEECDPDRESYELPGNLNANDKFFFGEFNNEPVEWKVLQKDDNGILWVISSKILLKMKYTGLLSWLNNEFMYSTFNDNERKYIKRILFNNKEYSNPYIFVSPIKALMEAEGTYQTGTIEETELAKSMSKNNTVYCMDGDSVRSDGTSTCEYSLNIVRGIRPMMMIGPDEVNT